MMESAHHGQGDDVALIGWFHRPRIQSILVQGSVRTMPMIIVEVVREPPAQVVLVEHDHVVQTFPAEGADQAFDKRILPGGMWRHELLFQSKVKGSPHKFHGVDAIAIAEQMARRLSVGKRLGQLLRRPSAEGESVILKWRILRCAWSSTRKT